MDQTKLASKDASAVRSGTRSALRSIALGSLLLRKQLWIWPILAAILLGACGWWVSRSVENAMLQRRMAELTTILNADIAAVQVWTIDQAKQAELIAKDNQLLPDVQSLLKAAASTGDSGRSLLRSPAQEDIRAKLKSQLALGGYSGFFVVSPVATVLAADVDAPVGKTLPGYQKGFFEQVAGGKGAVSRPFRSVLLLADEHGDLKANLPTMFAAAPLRGEKGEVIAVLGLRIRPDVDFTRILQLARSGATGETYAFDRDGLFLSESRFDDDLKQIGLLADLPDSHSVLTLELRDPGVDMTTGAGRPSAEPTSR